MGLLGRLFGKKEAATSNGSSQPLNWQASDAHLLLLSKFLSSNSPEWLSSDSRWEPVLRAPVESVVAEFERTGVLVEAGLAEKLSHLSSSELKTLMRTHGLKVSGRKDELAQRLANSVSDVAEKLTRGKKMLLCSDDAACVVRAYLQQREADRQDAQNESLRLMASGDFDAAAKVVVTYEAQQIFKRGLGGDWNDEEARSLAETLRFIDVARPGILGDIDDGLLKSLRLAASMMHTWGESKCGKWLPPDFHGIRRMDAEASARMVLFSASNTEQLSRAASYGATRVEISCVDDSCESCKTLAKRTYPINDVPELPHVSCTHPMGCRCGWHPNFKPQGGNQ